MMLRYQSAKTLVDDLREDLHLESIEQPGNIFRHRPPSAFACIAGGLEEAHKICRD